MADKNKKNENIKQSSGKAFLAMLLACIVILVGVFMISAHYSKEEELYAQMIDGTENADKNNSSMSRKGFPISFSNGIKTVEAGKDSLFVLSKNMVSVLKSNGFQQYSEAFSFSESTIKVSGNYALIFDRRGSSYILMNNKKTFIKDKSIEEGDIITADVDESGNFLIASKVKDATSALTYYNRNGKVKFHWLCANEHIVVCDISSDKNSIVCATLGSSNGNIYTKVYYFNIRNSDKNKEYKFKNSACIDCIFVERSRIVCNFENQRSVIYYKKKNKEPVTVKYNSPILLRDNDKGYTSVVTKLESSFDKSFLTVYNSSNAVIYSCEIPNNIIDVQSRGRKVYLLTKNRIYLASGGRVDSFMKVDASDGLCSFDGNVYYYSSGALYCR